MKSSQILNILIILSLTGCALSQSCSTTENNVDYKGNDIAMASNAIITSTTICCQLCAVVPGCTAFTYYANTCWLKSSSAGRIASLGRIKIIFKTNSCLIHLIMIIIFKVNLVLYFHQR